MRYPPRVVHMSDDAMIPLKARDRRPYAKRINKSKLFIAHRHLVPSRYMLHVSDSNGFIECLSVLGNRQKGRSDQKGMNGKEAEMCSNINNCVLSF